MQNSTIKEVDILKADAKALMDKLEELDPTDRRVVLAAIRGMMIALEK